METNIFDVLKLNSSELVYSNMLAWLFDAKGSHGLKGAFVREFILANDKALIKSCPDFDFNSFTVQTEVCFGKSGGNSGRMDLLLVSEKEKYVLCIENKVDTSEHDNQLERYEKYIFNKFASKNEDDSVYAKLFVYLTPLGEEPSSELWKKMDFKALYNLLVLVTEKAKGKKERFLLEDFSATVLAKAEEMRTVDNLFKKSIESWYKKRPVEYKELSLEHCTGMNAHFSGGKLAKLFPKSKNKSGASKSDNLFFIEIKFEKAEREKGKLNCLLTFTNHVENLKPDSLFQKLYPKQGNKKRWFCVKSISKALFTENETPEAYFDSNGVEERFSSTIEKLFAEMQKYIDEIIREAK